MEENKDMNKASEEAVDKAGFADVNYGTEEIKDEKPEKKGKKENLKLSVIISAAVLAVAVIALIAALLIKFDILSIGRSGNGLANAYNDPIGATMDGYLYHSNFSGNAVFKTRIDKEEFEQEKIMDVAAAFLAEHDGSFYFSDVMNQKLVRYEKNGKQKVIYDGLSYYHQYVGDYVYFMIPGKSYGGFIMRAPLKGGDAEPVLNVYTTNFCVSGKNIVYYDPAINSLCVTEIKNASKFAKNADGKENTSYEIGAIALTEKYAKNINVSGNDVYFVDATDGKNLICHIDMKSGIEEEMNFGTEGTLLNVSDGYMFYVGNDGQYDHLYRMNLDGKDIRDLTGRYLKKIMGFSVNEENIVLYGIIPKLNPETMRTESMYVTGVFKIDGTPLIMFPDDGMMGMGGMDAPIEIPEVTE